MSTGSTSAARPAPCAASLSSHRSSAARSSWSRALTGAALPAGTYALRAASTVTRLGALRTDTVSTLATNAVGAAAAGHVTDVRVARSEAVPFRVVGTA